MKTLIPVGSGRRLLFASGFAAIVALAVIGLFEMDDQSDAVAVKTVSVLVAKSYVASQSALDASCCFEKRIPEIYAPPRPLSKKDLGGNGAVRFRARGEILKGEILAASRVVDAAAGVSAGWDMAENETAVMIHFTPEGAMAGVVSPGDTVNVLSVFDSRACVLVPRARVLAVGKRGADGGAGSDDTLVTLALSPKDALRALLAVQKRVLALAIVSPANTTAFPKCVGNGEL